MSNKQKALIVLIPVLILIAVIMMIANRPSSSKEFTVTFDNQGSLTTQEVLEGEKVTKPIDPTKEGYKFTYWSIESHEFDFDTPITKDITLTAEFAVNVFYVTFENDGEIVDTKPVEYNHLVEPLKVNKEGYVFKYWSYNNEQFKFDTPITKDITLKAVWIAIEDIENFYTVTFNTGDTTFEQLVPEGTVVIMPENPTAEAYEFIAWTLDSEIFNFDTIITSDITLVARWKFKEYTIKYDTDGGATLPNDTVQHGYTFEAPIPTKNNSVFLYWEYEGEEFDFNTPITSHITLKAIWARDTYTITFSSSGSSVPPQTVKYNELVTKPTNPTHPEAEFLYWSYNNEEFDFNSPITKDIVLIAVFGDIKYTVTFDTDGGSDVPSQTVLSDKGVIMPIKPTKSGYEFLYWELDGEQFIFGNTIKKDITLKAIWKDISNATYYTVTFASTGGSAVSSQSIVEGGLINKPQDPTRLNYQFLYWTYNNEEFNFNTRVNENITLTAKWAINTFTVTFESDGGTYVAPQVISWSSKASFKTTTKIDHKFVEWQLDGEKFDFNTPITEDIILTAVWEKIIRYEVSYDSLGGTSVDSQMVESGLYANKPFNPIKKDFVFAYWEFQGTEFYFNTPITEDIKLTAKWVSSDVKVISFDSGIGASTVESSLLDIFDLTVKPEDPKREGYIFKCWNNGDEEFIFGSTITEDITLTAVWYKIPVLVKCIVSFVDTIYGKIYIDKTVDEKSTVSPHTVYNTDDHKFLYWEDENGIKFDFNTPITEDITLYTCWEVRVRYNITYDLDGGVLNTNTPPTIVEHGYRTASLSNPTKPFHEFLGWFLPNGSRFYFNSTYVYSDIHVTARWNMLDLNLTFEDRTVPYDSSIETFSVLGTIPNGVTVEYSEDNRFIDIGTYTITAYAKFEGNTIWSKSATLTITPINLTLSYSGDFEYEYTGDVIQHNVVTKGSGWAYWDNYYNSYKGRFVYSCSTDLTKVGTHTIKVTLVDTRYSPDNYILINDTFEITILSVRQYNFDYVIENNEVIITGFYNSIQTTLNVPSTIEGKPVTTIQANAFKDMKNLTTITLANSITTIGNNAFQGCTSLTEANLGTGLKFINDYAFNGCSKLKTVTYGNNLVSIGHSAFSGAGLLSDISVSSNLTSVGNSSFYNTDITHMPFGNRIETIGTHAFRYCYELKEVVLPNSLTVIGERAFSECTYLTKVTLSSNLTTIGGYAFYKVPIKEIVIPNSVTSIGTYAFQSCSLESLVLSNNLETISSYAFDGNYKLSSINFNNTSKLKVIGTYAFRNAALTNLSIPSSVERIDNYAFYSITELTNIVIPNNVTTFGTGIFDSCTGLTSFKLPDGIETIPNSIFSGCTGFTTLSIPASVKVIGDSAFKGCTNVTKLTFNGNNLVTINGSAFNNLNLLESLSLPISVVTIGSSAFANWKSLKAINLPSSVTTLGSGAFSSCTSLTTVTVPNTVKSMSTSVFSGCTSLTRAVINADITGLPNSTFSGCTSLTSVSLPKSFKSIGEYAFYNCKSLNSFTIDSNITHINYRAFEGCSTLGAITIPINVTSISSYAFRYCSKINIFVEAKSKPSGWSSSWASNIGTSGDSSTGKVIWDCNNI